VPDLKQLGYAMEGEKQDEPFFNTLF